MRHRWLRLRPHAYICLKCGTGKVNVEMDPGCWVATFHLPTGYSAASRHVPPCEVGAHTERYLAKHQDTILAGGVPK